ncbi:hypothetical protein QAD02_006321 [Eretmocerus hayati]|uniref:Uncharacterized protein n=1 Tax=Eretmocerus hayati TaxID=131215 RepID=A0ACC2N0L3_9HYME|nr:hypothetical protein QAD02_006321 [Eretmocerus hayati]
MKVLLISMVFFAPILAAPRPDYEADVEEARNDIAEKIMALENKVLRILGKDGFYQYMKGDYTGAVEKGAHHNGETVNDTIKRLVNLMYELKEPSRASQPDPFEEICLKEFKESGWPHNAEKTVSSRPECKELYTAEILLGITESVKIAREVLRLL